MTPGTPAPLAPTEHVVRFVGDATGLLGGRSIRRIRASNACLPWSRRGGSLGARRHASRGINTPCGHGSPPHTTLGTAPATCRHDSVRPGVGRDSGTGDAARAFTVDPRRATRRRDHAPLSVSRWAIRTRNRCPRTLVAVARRCLAPSRPRTAHAAPGIGTHPHRTGSCHTGTGNGARKWLL